MACRVADEIYTEVDHRYANMDDGFGIAQSILNIVETAIALLAVVKVSCQCHYVSMFSLSLSHSPLTLSHSLTITLTLSF